MMYQRYRDDIETIQPDEPESIDGLIKGTTQQSETVEKREGHAVRASHAKSSACAVGELTVADGLSPELAQGLFAVPGAYQVAARFAQGPGESLGDRVSTHRGMAIRAFGVEGEKLPGHDADTQDSMLATGTTSQAVVVDRGLVTSRKPDDILAFNLDVIKLFASACGDSRQAAGE